MSPCAIHGAVLSHPRSLRRALTTSFGLVALLVSLFAWAFASPIGASPDEDYHLVSVWCARGEIPGTCETGASDASREVPVAVRQSACYAFDPAKSAQCQVEPLASDELIDTDRGNFRGDYPPVFYAVMSVFVGSDPSFSVLVMRMVNATLVVTLVAAVALVAPAGVRRPLVLALVACAVPFGMFLVPSINPSGWAIAAVPLTFAATAGFLRVDGRRVVALGALAGVGVLMGAGARSDAALYLILALVVAVFVSVRVRRTDAPRLLWVAALVVAAAASFLSSGQSSAAASVREEPGSLKELVDILVTVPWLWEGNFGSWGLGWLDTGLPPVVSVVGWAVFSGALVLCLSGRGGRWGLGVAGVAAAVLVVPAYIQYASGVPVGEGVQPRYVLPLMVLLLVVAGLRLRGAALRLVPAQRWVMVAALATTNAVALHTNIRRYVTGNDVATLDLDAGVEWWWGLPIGPLGVWAVGAVAFGVALTLLTGELARPTRADALTPLRLPALRRRPATTHEEPTHRAAPAAETVAR